MKTESPASRFLRAIGDMARSSSQKPTRPGNSRNSSSGSDTLVGSGSSSPTDYSFKRKSIPRDWSKATPEQVATKKQVAFLMDHAKGPSENLLTNPRFGRTAGTAKDWKDKELGKDRSPRGRRLHQEYTRSIGLPPIPANLAGRDPDSVQAIIPKGMLISTTTPDLRRRLVNDGLRYRRHNKELIDLAIAAVFVPKNEREQQSLNDSMGRSTLPSPHEISSSMMEFDDKINFELYTRSYDFMRNIGVYFNESSVFRNAFRQEHDFATALLEDRLLPYGFQIMTPHAWEIF